MPELEDMTPDELDAVFAREDRRLVDDSIAVKRDKSNPQLPLMRVLGVDFWEGNPDGPNSNPDGDSDVVTTFLDGSFFEGLGVVGRVIWQTELEDERVPAGWHAHVCSPKTAEVWQHGPITAEKGSTMTDKEAAEMRTLERLLEVRRNRMRDVVS